MHQSIVFAKGQTTLPKPVCEALGVEALRYIISEGTVQVLRSRSVADLAGMLALDGHAPVSLDELDEAIVQGAIENGK
jgi:bifunctional DNA-binding transcriptional regulator/antitoxin component of YhaV-PrlF toxin-antitoxin module